MSRRSPPRALALGVALGLSALLLPGAVLAAAPAADGADGPAENCVARLELIQPDAPAARIASQTCFSTFAKAINFATAGQTSLKSKATPEMLTQEMLPAASVASSFVLGIDWECINYLCASQTWTAATGCDFSHWYTLAYVGDAWNDRTESAKGFSGCVHYRHYQHSNFGGIVKSCNPNCPNMGPTLGNRTSSEQFDD